MMLNFLACQCFYLWYIPIVATLLDSIVRLPPSVCEFNSVRRSLINTLQQMSIVPTKQFVASADKVDKLAKGSLSIYICTKVTQEAQACC